MRVSNSLKTTPFHARTAPLVLGQAWRRWAGYAVASAYDWLHDREYAAIRNAAALSMSRRCTSTASPVAMPARLLDRMVTRNVHKLQVGQVMYTPWCDAHGKVIDDGTVSRLARVLPPHVGRADLALAASERGRTCKSRSKRSPSRSARSRCRGRCRAPCSNRVAETSLDSLKYFRIAPNRIAGVDVEISRTGYTGDLGYEIWVPAAQRDSGVGRAHAAPARTTALTPAGIWALDVARIEAGLRDGRRGLPLRASRADRGPEVLALRASLDWTVSLDKEVFNGHRALDAEKASGPAVAVRRHRSRLGFVRGAVQPLKLAAALPMVAWRSSTPLYRDGTQIGYASSGVLVAAAQEIPRARARPGAAFRAGHAGRDRSDGGASAQARRTPGCASCRSSTPSGRRPDGARRTTA